MVSFENNLYLQSGLAMDDLVSSLAKPQDL